MKVGDLVKFRRDMFRDAAPVGVIVKNAEKGKWKTAWWLVQWSDGKSEIISDRNLMVINASR